MSFQQRSTTRRRGALVPTAVMLGLIAVLLAVLLVNPPATLAPAEGGARVVRVVDGDTVVVEVAGREESVRLIGIDTPESVATDRPDECFGIEASNRLATLLAPGTEVRLVRDVEPRDRYDRLLAYVVRVDDGLFVNAAQVTDGYATAEDHPPNSTHRDDFARAERTARAEGRGLWAACGGEDVPLGQATR